nr:ectonucleoside triphosphate diphosphohydrolase 2 isoform X3 [Vulpes vulpes]
MGSAAASLTCGAGREVARRAGSPGRSRAASGRGQPWTVPVRAPPQRLPGPRPGPRPPAPRSLSAAASSARAGPWRGRCCRCCPRCYWLRPASPGSCCCASPPATSGSRPPSSMALSWTLALLTHPCSSTSGLQTKRMIQASWASTAPVRCTYGWVGQWFQPRKGTLGAMDLGGASTQITFEMAGPAEDPTNEVQLRLYGQHYRVYTHSFLCYGRDQVLLRLLAGALQTYGFHPCWPRGYSSQVLLQDVYESPCTAAQWPQTFTGSTRVNLSGTSDPALCRGLILELFNFSSCHFSQCSFNGIFQPPVAGNFIAFSAFFYTVDFLRTVMGLPVETLQQLEVAVVTICNQTWSELQARVPGEQARLPDYCAVATFVQQLLSQGYGFQEHAFRGVTFQKKAGDTTVGWALGYMLNLTNLIPAEPPGMRKGTDFSAWVALVLLCAAILLAAAVLLLRRVRAAKLSSTI